jgi:hypothetical protein
MILLIIILVQILLMKIKCVHITIVIIAMGAVSNLPRVENKKTIKVQYPPMYVFVLYLDHLAIIIGGYSSF